MGEGPGRSFVGVTVEGKYLEGGGGGGGVANGPAAAAQTGPGTEQASGTH